MTGKKDILKLPNKVLRQKSKAVTRFGDDIELLTDRMKTIGLDWEDGRDFEICVGLAAIQIGELKRVIILRTADTKERKFDILINPKVVKTYGQVRADFEGCLSVADVYGLVPRFEKVKVQALNEKGQLIRKTYEGFDAVIAQHEIDHTKGVLFVDHIKGIENAFHYINENGKIESLSYDKVISAGIFR